MITDSQRDSIVIVLSKMLQAIDAYRDQVAFDPSDLGTSFDFETGYQPTMDDLLKRWRMDPVGTGLRQGIKEIGRIVAPHVTMPSLLKIAEDASECSQIPDYSIAIFTHMWDGLVTSDGETWLA